MEQRSSWKRVTVVIPDFIHLNMLMYGLSEQVYQMENTRKRFVHKQIRNLHQLVPRSQ